MALCVVEPYNGGSHALLLPFLERLSRSRGYPFTAISLPGRKHSWRLSAGSVWAARAVPPLPPCSTLLCSGMLNVCELLSLRPDLRAHARVVLYMHENQLVYPRAEGVEPDASRAFHHGWAQLTSMLVADVVAWNSLFNLDSFVAALPALLGGMDKAQRPGAAPLAAAVYARSVVLHFPVPPLPLSPPPPPPPPFRLRVAWPHRWEHDKGPAVFFEAVLAPGVDCEVCVLGQAFAEAPPVFATARAALEAAGRVARWSFAPSRAEYAAALAGCDVVVSTAAHEFFGVAVAEGVAAGCWPLCPDALAYPELYAPQAREAAAAAGAEDRAAAVLRESGQRRALALAELLAPEGAAAAAAAGEGDGDSVYTPPPWLRLSGRGSGGGGGGTPPPRKSPYLYSGGAAGLAAALTRMQRELPRVRAWGAELREALRSGRARSSGGGGGKKRPREGVVACDKEWGSTVSAAALAERSWRTSAAAMEGPFACLLPPPPALTYSLWLRLEPAADAALQRVVDDLSLAHGTLPFSPHVTVVPQFALPAEQRGAAEGALRALAAATPPLRVFFEGTAAGGDPAHWRWRCVYAVCRREGPLMDLPSRARLALGLPPAAEPFFPHASVVYSDCGALARAAMRDMVAPRVDTALAGGTTACSLELWETTVEGAWRQEAAFPLGAEAP
jgi:hypothetical protein